MRNFAKFEIIGRIGKIDVKEKVVYLQIAANYRKKSGEDYVEDTYWNRVTVLSERDRKYIESHVAKGSLVRVAGRMRDTQFDVAGETRFGTDRIVDEFGVLAKPGEATE